uniref:Uncharacterized protein n=1 Tax=Roseihalotalea indica TaxID=2867963 RepID=A0AA49JJ83_9BACT|nr:hypothetical protein K4G66_09660 [Tunicatimonas sp. TK19036]
MRSWLRIVGFAFLSLIVTVLTSFLSKTEAKKELSEKVSTIPSTITISKGLSEKTLPWLSFAVSALTLILGYVAYEKLLADQVRTEQLTLVIKLTEVIQDDVMIITSYGVTPSFGFPPKQEGNIYAISTWEEFKLDYDIYSINAFEWELESFKYLYNPLLPEAIAKSLFKFRYDFQSLPIMSLDSLAYFRVIGNPIDTTKFYSSLKDVIPEIGLFYWKYNGGMENFVANAKSVREEIVKYFESSGIETINPLIFETANRRFPYNMSKYDQVKKEHNLTDAQTEKWFEALEKMRDIPEELDSATKERMRDSIINWVFQ